jgi:phosphatidylethanolamine/phosphatidyl-N-methylethanolamine N-methyltransferase
MARKVLAGKDRFQDEARFLRSWLERPLVMGAVTPSGKILARTMASFVDPRIPGPVVELGPGTGPVTDALIRRGVAQDRLVLVEYSPEFCQLLKRRFPRRRSSRGTPTT